MFIPPIVSAATPVNHTDVSYVCTDDHAAARMANDYLMSLSHQKIVYITGPKGSILSKRRLKRYCDALSQISTPMSIWRIDGDRVEGPLSSTYSFVTLYLPRSFDLTTSLRSA